MNMKRKKLKTDDEFTRIGCSWYPNIFLVWIWCFLSFMLKVMCTPLQRGNRTQKKWNQFILNIEYWILRLHPVSILNTFFYVFLIARTVNKLVLMTRGWDSAMKQFPFRSGQRVGGSRKTLPCSSGCQWRFDTTHFPAL